MTGKEYLYFGDDTGKTFKFNPSLYTDDSKAIAMRIKTKYYSFGDLGRVDLLKRFQVFGKYPNGLLVSVSIRDIDGKSDYEILQDIRNEVELVDVYEKGNAFSIGLDDYSDNSIEVEGFKFEYTATKDIY